MSKGKEKQQADSIAQKYSMGADLGDGGNATVYVASYITTGEKVALKKLSIWNQEKEARFQEEIVVMTGVASKIEGVMPILDYSREHFWYTMPIATKVMDAPFVKNGNVVEIVQAFLPLLTTLQQLHEKDISHRDIKPANIYLLNNRLTFGDFGLVDYPYGADLTQSDRPLGAIFTRAPEMLRNPKGANGKPTDIYSMAKTLWMLLTKDDKGFDGQYNERDDAHRLNGFEHLKNEHLLEIEQLLTQATHSNPTERPTAKEFQEQLKEWLVIYNDGELAQAKDWEHLSDLLFSGMSPDSVSYSGAEKVVRILDMIAHCRAYNHMFVPKRGGLDLEHVKLAKEDGCIKIFGNGCLLLLKPKTLYFRCFKDIRWNYFLLETEPLEKVLPDGHNDGWYEAVVEDIPGHYVDDKDACYGVYDYDTGVPFPEGWCSLERVLRGKFLFVMKMGPYNKISATYDARHCDCSEQQFYELISSYERILNDGVKYGFTAWKVLEHHRFSANPYAKPEIIEDEEQLLPSPKDYMNKHIGEWTFKVPVVNNPDGIMKYYFKFDNGDWDFHSIFEEPKIWLLNVDGHFVECDSSNDKNVFFVTDREEAFRIVEALEKQLEVFCQGYDTEYLSYFKIGWKRIGKPTHLFTKDEMEQLYREADDRRGNKLVIDENGFAKLLPIKVQGDAYPVCHESFQDRRNYVGKYSPLRTLNTDYMESLGAWLAHLKRDTYVYCDGSEYPSASEVELIKEIRKFY